MSHEIAESRERFLERMLGRRKTQTNVALPRRTKCDARRERDARLLKEIGAECVESASPPMRGKA